MFLYLYIKYVSSEYKRCKDILQGKRRLIYLHIRFFNLLSTNPTKWQPTNCLIAFDQFVGLAVKELRDYLPVIYC